MRNGPGFWIGGAFAGGYGLFALYSRSALNSSIFLFLLIAGTLSLALMGCALLLWQKRSEGNRWHVTAGAVLFWSVIIHIFGVWGQPLFEDDYFRYLWDAWQTWTTGSPYGVAPSVFFGDASLPDRFNQILSHINHPDIPTIYGPTLQYTFVLGHLIAPGEVWALQLIFAIANLALIAMLLRVAPPRIVILYAWSPLVFKEVLLTAHPDGFGAALLFAAVFLRYRQQMTGTAILLGLSIGAKIFALPLVPFLMIRAKWFHWGALGLALLALYLPLTQAEGSDMGGLGRMAGNFEFNSALFGLLAAVVPAFWSKALLGIALMFFWGACYYRYRHQYHKTGQFRFMRGDWILGALLLCSPVINPWYLIWVLPFAVVFPSRTVWVATFAVLLAYLVPINLIGSGIPIGAGSGPYDQPLWVRWLEFGLVAGVALYEAHTYAKGSRTFWLR